MARTKVLFSNVFRRSVIASAGFVAVGLALIWLFGAVRVGLIERAEWQAVDAAIAEVQAVFDAEGMAGVADLYGSADDPVWGDELLYQKLEDRDPVIAIRNSDNDIILGFEGFWPPEEDGNIVWLDHEDIGDGLRAAAFGLSDDHWGTIGRFIPENEYYWDWVLPQMTDALLWIGLPLSLVIGYFLSRGVLGRIEDISDTAEAVGAGRMTARVELRGTGDEFDRLSEKLNTMLDRVDALNRNIEAVSVGVAHDLKTPLANIGGRLELIRRDQDDPAAIEDHVAAAEGYLDGLLRVFDALLRLGEVESGKRRVAFAPLDLSNLAQEMATSFDPLFEEARKSLAVVIAPKVVVQGDGDLIQQLIANLLENALEHTRDAARVFLELEASSEGPVLRVGDDGPGISPKDKNRLFERFYRGDQSRNTPGNGLGLSLVKSIADLHDADIELLGDRSGAVFEIRFPRPGKDYENV